jgi:dephospho-CoA kinase
MGHNKLLVGITGGIGAGKSLVSSIFNHIGIPIYNADQRARELSEKDPEIIEGIRNLFGEEAVNDMVPDRGYIASKAFTEPELLEKLNLLIHPKVSVDFKIWVEGVKNVPYVLKEAALLFESGSYKSLDKVILVKAPVDTRIRRVILRDSHRTKEQVLQIMDRQLSEEENATKADFFINNENGQYLLTQVLTIHQKLCSSI